MVKVLSLRHAEALKGHELLVREAETLRRLEHPRIPRLLDFFTEEGEDDTRVCLVQEHVAGRSLADLVSRGRRFGEAEAATVGAKLAGILEYLHGFRPPILHRDVKPANVLLSGAGRVYLVDFGAVRDHFLRAPLLHPGGVTVVGTRGYMPLEQFEGRAVPASDLYALGATLVHVLSGRAPSELEKDGLVLDFRPHVDVSAGFADLLARLLRPDWRDRPGSATEVREELERVAASAKSPARRARRPASTAAAAAAVAAAVAALGVVLFTLRGGLSGQERSREDAARSTWLASAGDVDTLGDPLPAGAARRLGGARLRHGGAVRGVALTPDGTRIVSVGEDGTASVWTAETGEEIRRFDLGEPATALALSPDGSTLVAGSERFWSAHMRTLDGRDVARLLPMGTEPTPSVAVQEVAWSRDGRLVATRTHGSLDLWDGGDGRHRQRLPGCGSARGLAFVSGSAELLAGCDDGSARLFATGTGRERRRLALGAARVPVVVTPDERQVAVPGSTGLTLVDVATGERAVLLQDPTARLGDVTSAALSADGATLVTGHSDGRLHLWDLTTPARGRAFEAHSGAVTAVALSPDGATAVSGGADGAVRQWDVATGEERSTPAGHRGAVRALEFTGDGATLLSAAADGTLRRWQPDGAQVDTRSFDQAALGVFALSPARVLAVEDGRFHVLDVATGWEVTEGPLPRTMRGFAVSRAAGRLAVGTATELGVLEVETGRRRSFPVPRTEQPVAFTPDGRVVATLRQEAEPLAGRPLVFRDAETGEELRTQAPSRGGPGGGPCHSADGTYLLFGGGLWRLKGRPPEPLENVGYHGRAGECAVSPDGRRLAYRHPDDPDAIEVRELAEPGGSTSGLLRLGTLEGHRGRVTSLAFAPDSRTLASGGADSSILLWDVESLREQGPPRGGPAEERPGPVLRLSFDDGIGGPGVAPVRLPAVETRVRLVPGRAGRALQLEAPLRFPEMRALRLDGDFSVELWFRVAGEALTRGGYVSVLSSDLVSLDVRPGGRAHLFLHTLGGGHAGVDLRAWLGRVDADQWYHVGVAHRRADGTTRVCVDGVCGPGPTAPNLSDRVRELELGRSSPGVASGIAVDELAIHHRARSDDELAASAGRLTALALRSPAPDEGRVVPGMPAEAEPVPREALPEGLDVASMVAVEKRDGLTVYRFTGPLATAEALDVDLGLGAVWVGTSRGLLRHDPRTGAWRRWDETAGLPGARLFRIAVVGDQVVVDSSTPTGASSVRGTGLLALDPRAHAWRTLDRAGSAWDLWGDGTTLWLGLRQGAEARDLAAGTTRTFRAGEGGLLHASVHAVRRQGSTVWFAMLGDWVQAKRDFEGGGVSVLDEKTGGFRSYTVRDGLARGYSSDLFVDESDVFVAHWDEERGLSRLDRRGGRWEVLRRSANGVDLGGVVLAGDGATIWIGQQGGLVRYDRRTREARLMRESDGLPGYVVSAVAVGDDSVWASVWARDQDGVRVTGLVRLPRSP